MLALVGPPGVGKTSLGESVARTMGRKSIQKIKDTVKATTYRSTRHQNLDELLRSLNRTLSGWRRAAGNDRWQHRRRARGPTSPVIMLLTQPEQNRRTSKRPSRAGGQGDVAGAG